MQLPEGISFMTPSDFRDVVAVWEKSVRATHHFLTEADIVFFRPFVHDALLQMDTLVGVRDEAGQVIGFLGVAHQKVEMLFVHPDWIGQGLGTRLLRYAVLMLDAQEVDVNEQNEPALSFYIAKGYEVVGRSEIDGTGKPFPLLHLRVRDFKK